jgi:acetate kinase
MSRHILALNCGSSSVKSALFDAERLDRAQSLRVESIGTTAARLHVGEAQRPLEGKPDLAAAVSLLLEELVRQSAVVEAVVHRVVHGGARFVKPQLLDSAVLEALDDLNSLAPLHNPPALTAIRAAQAAYPDIPHIAVFDTAFHATLPQQAREYALPTQIRASFGIRRYGFHGLSHSQVMRNVAEHMGRAAEELKIVSCHLGNGASVTAIEQGRSVETSMGMTPLEGLVMGTRAGDIDPGVLLHLLQARGMSIAEVDAMLNRGSGLKGLTGTNDMREIERRATQGDEDCREALQIYAHRVRKYIGAYAAVMGGVDAIAFTGGVGENSAGTRQHCLQRLEHLGAVLDEQRNREVRLSEKNPCIEISRVGSPTRLLVVRADEELTMAREAARLLNWPSAASASS